jgi:hypothetical protein
MHCTRCGTLAPADAQFCAKCGNAIVATLVQTEPDASTVTADAPKPKPPRQAWLYVVGALLAVGCAGDLVFAFRGQSPNPQLAYVNLLWGGLFFYLLWKRRGRKGWQGAPIGVAVAAFMQRGAG